MKNIILITTFSLFAFVSCKKEKFPEINDLTSSWIEQTSNSLKCKLVFENETMYFIKPTFTDTLSYRLDKKQGVIYLSLKYNPSSGETSHKILINKKKKELTIWDLFVGINTSETVFKKE